MRFVFSLSEWSLGHRPETWLEHLAVCINSMRANTNLEPVMIWRGTSGHRVAKVMKGAGVDVIAPIGGFAETMLAESYPATRPAEVSLSTLGKLYSSYLLPDAQLIVGDVDTLWLRQPEAVHLGPGIAAGPQMWPGDRGLNAGMCVIDCAAMREAQLLPVAERLVRSGIESDERILNELFAGRYASLPWEHRAFWPMPAHTPAVVHFHGPKLDQIRSLSIRQPETACAITTLYRRGASELHTWAKIAEAYRNAPVPLLNLLTESKP